MIIGLTGSIAMGKSTTSEMFRQLGYPVFDADDAVDKLYEKGGAAVAKIKEAFPTAILDGAVDRNELTKLIAEDQKVLPILEKIVHPLVTAAEAKFIDLQKSKGAKLLILDNPLLFEMNKHTQVDTIVVVSTSHKIQKQRALARKNMTPEKLQIILSRQMPDSQKRLAADFIIDTSISLQDAFSQVKKVVKALDPTFVPLKHPHA